MFPFSGKTAAVTGVSDDPALIANSGGETPSGRYVRVDISCMDGTFTGDHMSMVLKSFSLRDENRNTYPVAFSGFAVAGEFDFDSMEFSVIKPVFDVPANIAINTLTLLAPGENEGETIILPLADVPPIQEQSEEKTAATTADAAPQSVAGLSLADAAFSAVTEDGLYAVPYDENIVFIVNNTTDATVQLQGASDHLLSYSCMLTLDAPVGEARLELRLYQNGAQILSDTTNTALQGGENKLEALFKLQEAVSGNYRLELWYNDTLVDVQELAG
ncbi:hypothetical protein SDC9_138070 [bioreactor metagenome]|uniref:Uncharacterized protein n=1 Tax=bioreactor metagenome TaxID=1076179 RepID=A0A645DNS6_9ZZZZ